MWQTLPRLVIVHSIYFKIYSFDASSVPPGADIGIGDRAIYKRGEASDPLQAGLLVGRRDYKHISQ